MNAGSLTADVRTPIAQDDPADSRPPTLGAKAVNGLLDRFGRQERESLRLMAEVLPPPTFDAVFELYHASGCLYPAKLTALRSQMPAIEDTWRRALEPDTRVLRIVARRGIVDSGVRLRSAITAFAYAAGTWQGQHLVSRERHEYTGTLAVLIELVEGLHRLRSASHPPVVPAPQSGDESSIR